MTTDHRQVISLCGLWRWLEHVTGVALFAVIDVELSLKLLGFIDQRCWTAKRSARGECQCSIGVPPLTPQHFLNFLPLPQGQGSFLPTLGSDLTTGIIGVFIPKGCVIDPEQRVLRWK